jgi:hypothetical protein
MKRLLLASIFAIQTSVALSQTYDFAKAHSQKGKMFISWGWNHAAFTQSDIHFKGNAYNFTLKDVVAKDRQTGFSLRYFNPSKITIPQYNFRIGYFFNSRYSISFGFDHMKYVMKQNQTVLIKGSIAGTGTEYDRDYRKLPIQLKPDFLRFEHTNGLNYLNLEVRRMDNLFDQRSLKIKNIDINLIEGAGAGILFPKSDVALLNYDENDQWHVAGYGIDVVTGLNITFFKHFFIQGEVKGGFINMPDILTTHFTDDRAAQHFFFAQGNVNFGVLFKL